MKVLVFGATGLAGAGVLRASLASSAVTDVRAIVRRSTGVRDPKLREVLHADYLDYEAIRSTFADVDACFFCLGVSVSQVPDEAEYRRIHQAFPLAAARMLRAASPGASFHYLSGGRAALDSRWMWARVKAEAERDLMAEIGATCWRPGMIDGEPSASQPALTRFLRPVLRAVFRPFPSLYVMNDDIGRAMLQATKQKTRNRIVENAELRAFADQFLLEAPEK